MIRPKVCGIETEYGIFVEGDDVSPVTASSLLVNAYAESCAASQNWNFSDESPHIDARSGDAGGAVFPVVESTMANSVLVNGARFYVDHAHPEYSSPECSSPMEALLYDLAGEEIVRRALRHANRHLPEGVRLVAHKNNSDGRGNSYGCHENYLVDRSVPFGLLSRVMTTHFVTRQIFCGAGKVVVEQPREGEPRPTYQISQRADFFEEEVGLETTVRRPIINTRDEPHCDPARWRRLHVIVGDANMSQTATLVKLGSSAIILSMLEDGWAPEDLFIGDPVSEIRRVSHDTTLGHLVEFSGGRRMTALECQIRLLEEASRWASNSDELAEQHGPLLDLWGTLLVGLERDPLSMAHVIDWIAKKRLVDGLVDRHGLSTDHPRVRAIDLQYHDMDPDRNIQRRLGMVELHPSDAIETAVNTPPDSTRAYFRGECIRRWPDRISSVNWDSIVFVDREGRLKRVLMMDPLKGTRERVGGLLDRVTSVDELLSELGDEAVEPVIDDPGW